MSSVHLHDEYAYCADCDGPSEQAWHLGDLVLALCARCAEARCEAGQHLEDPQDREERLLDAYWERRLDEARS